MLIKLLNMCIYIPFIIYKHTYIYIYIYIPFQMVHMTVMKPFSLATSLNTYSCGIVHWLAWNAAIAETYKVHTPDLLSHVHIVGDFHVQHFHQNMNWNPKVNKNIWFSTSDHSMWFLSMWLFNMVVQYWIIIFLELSNGIQ